jgi:CheY-like chemotaxis protein
LSKCVLVVEDEPLIRLLVIDILSEAGFEVLEAQDPAEALTVLKSDEQIDVLLTDVRMPGCIDGFELAEVAKRSRPKLRVIVTSGYIARGDLPSGTNFLHKPFSASDLLKRVRQVAA